MNKPRCLLSQYRAQLAASPYGKAAGRGLSTKWAAVESIRRLRCVLTTTGGGVRAAQV